MSMNVSIFASRSIICEKTNEHDKQLEYFDCWQTPTSDSYAIYGDSNNPEEARIEAYREWVRSWASKSPAIAQHVNPHLKALDTWIEYHTAKGYSIHLEVW